MGSVDLRGSLRGFGFVDCGIVSRSSLVRRVIGRMYSANWGDIVLDSETWVVFVEGTLCRKVSWLVVRNYQGLCKRLTTGDSLHMVFGRR